MCPDPSPAERINSVALVSYIPEPLSGFLNSLRQELVPNCFLRAHVTILPPRPCLSSLEAAFQSIQHTAKPFRPFEVALNSIEIFPVSDVIYVSIGRGEQELRQMHDAMNRDGVLYKEPFAYHPHITLAQLLKPDEVDELKRVAKTRWAEFAASRTFRVETVTFVQATKYKTWVDLNECTLEEGPVYDPALLAAEDPLALHP